MKVLVDTSVWIDYFRSGANSSKMDALLDKDIIATNEIILTELVPFLRVKRQKKLVNLLNRVNKLSLQIRWDEIIEFQVKCLKSGRNGIGIPDLLIAQNALQHGCQVYSLDKHFYLLNQVIKVNIFQEQSNNASR